MTVAELEEFIHLMNAQSDYDRYPLSAFQPTIDRLRQEENLFLLNALPGRQSDLHIPWEISSKAIIV
jgi:hypothetical protein